MSVDKDLEQASNALVILDKSLRDCSDAQFENCERELQQKGYYSFLKNLFLEIRNARQAKQIAELVELVKEHEQKRLASTVKHDDEA